MRDLIVSAYTNHRGFRADSAFSFLVWVELRLRPTAHILSGTLKTQELFKFSRDLTRNFLHVMSTQLRTLLGA